MAYLYIVIDVGPVRRSSGEAELLAGYIGCVVIKCSSTHRLPHTLHLVLQVTVTRITGVVMLYANILICAQQVVPLIDMSK